ncbi:MAG: flavodoxin family protein, partial [Synergistaceae bacterium]|nr:flavodoxin family protein [Synergistaceae bacterium]
MKTITKLHLVYFSPSGSTEKVVKAVASEFTGMPVETINLLTSSSRKKRYTFGHEDIVIFGMITA